MNSRSSSSRPGRNSPSTRSSRSVSVIERSAGKPSKRWQPKQGKTAGTIATPQNMVESVLSPSEREALLRRQALLAAQEGQFTEAIALFTQLLNLNPQSARDYNNRGLVYFQHGQMEQAIADYNLALALNPTLDSAYNNRANYYASQKMFLEAILDYDMALDLNPTNIRAWINQGITCRELEMWDRAIESFDCALALNRLVSHVYAERGRTYHLCGDWNCAIADYHRALASLAVPSATIAGHAARLRLQIENWMAELLG